MKYTLSKLEHTGWLMYSDSSIQSSTLKAGQEIQCTSEKLFHDFFVYVYMVAHTKLTAILTGSLYQFHSPVSKGLNLPVPTSLQSQHKQSVPWKVNMLLLFKWNNIRYSCSLILISQGIGLHLGPAHFHLIHLAIYIPVKTSKWYTHSTSQKFGYTKFNGFS